MARRASRVVGTMSPAASTSVPAVAPEERRRARKALVSGASLGYQLSSLTSAGPATIVAATLTHVFGGGIAVGVYLMVLCVIAFAATLPLRDGTRADIDPRTAPERAAEPTGEPVAP